ncbi:magnesium/cobalt transporter CorA [Algoriphagus namhaensis]
MTKKRSILRRALMPKINLFTKKKNTKLGLPPGAFVFTGDKKLEEVHVEVTLYDEDTYEQKSVTLEELPQILSQREKVLWIDVTGLHDVAAMEQIATLFGINRLTMEDILDVDQRPKMEVVEDYLHASVKMIQKPENGGAMDVEQVSFVLKNGVLVTFQEREGDVFSYVRGRLSTSTGSIRKRRADYLLYALLDSIVDSYFVVLESIGQELEALEDAAINQAGDHTLNAIYFQRKQLMAIRRAIYPLREVSGIFQKYGDPHVSKSITPFLQDMHENITQVIEVLDGFRDLSNSVLDLCMNVLSNKMNNIMKVLTVISTIFIPLSFVAGVYGMNFEFMPELHYRYGYFYVLGGMVLSMLIMLGFFRWKKWF